MDAYLLTLQPAPQAGWAMQYTPEDLRPAAARTYEPAALATSTTAGNVDRLILFHRWTGDAKFLARIPEALAWLESCRLAPEFASGREFPTFVEVGTNRPLFLHRTGSNAANGRYFADYDPRHTTGHYSSFRQIDLAGLRAHFEEAKVLDPAELARNSPLTGPGGDGLPPRLFTLSDRRSSDRNDIAVDNARHLSERVRETIRALDPAGYWPTPLMMTSHPYRGPAPAEVSPGDFGSTLVGDESDTSPFRDPEPVTGISVAAYIRNMGKLIAWLEEQPRADGAAAVRD
jgi:hypothetical protein